MDIFVLALLGFVQGLCEFLPISSSGHLVLLSKIFGVENSLFLSILLHVATLLAIIVVFKKEIWHIIKHPFSKESMNICIATLPTCLIVIVLMPIINSSFEGNFLPFAFLLSAILLGVSELVYKKREKFSFVPNFSLKTAVTMGIAQGLAIFPGISRSGTTICAGLLKGGDKKEVAKFSFLMSIPIIILSMFMEIWQIVADKQIISINIPGVILAFIIAFLVGLLSIKIMINFTSKINFKWFIIYLLIISVISFLII